LGKEKKIHVSIRLEPKVLALIIKQYGSTQKWIDSMLGGPQRTNKSPASDEAADKGG
jgi:hypothetical protein